ncbi:MAG: cytochrome d ubiquinol oxidase subunit II [Elusimicrobiota bacterium]|jgi:cytochrome d ubiquinol oxidase subunit II
MDLNTVWFALVVVLLAGYALLDGFDLGVGTLHLLARGDEERRTLMNAIGPVWDGNEVWLLTGGGALFAAFPNVYATVFSGFYTALMLVLLALILRAMSLEFRGKLPGAGWRAGWDAAFSISSALAALLLGVALGNILRGVPIGPDGEFAGSFLGLLNPWSLLMGLTTVALFALHGALYLGLKVEGTLLERVRAWAKTAYAAFGVLYALTLGSGLFVVPRFSEALRARPLLLAAPVGAILAVLFVRRSLAAGREGRAFVSSCAAIALTAAFFGGSLYPALVPSNPLPENGLTIYNACSSPKTLKIMLVIALTGMPLVIAYQTLVYRVFKGPVRLGPTSY